MSAHDQQRLEWEAFTAAQHAKGLCEFSGMRVSRCVVSICDCFETPEGAAKIERQAADQRELAEKFANADEIREAAIDELVEAGELCHCGSSVDISEGRGRGMCSHCDDVRCDAFPGECGRDDAARILRGSAHGATMTGGEE